MAGQSNPVVHLELHTGDMGGACSFYERLFDWRPRRIDAGGSSYLAMQMGAGLGGGIVECPIERPLWLPYVEVDDVGAVTDRAQQLGASVTLRPREGPAGWRSAVVVPSGGEVAFWQQKR
jgi:uncharacterized protein